MAFQAPLALRIRFGAFDLNTSSGELSKSGVPVKLRRQAVEVLIMLTERAGQVVTREEIRERLWSANTFVDFERSINFCINQIRAALGDDADNPRYVETLPRRGYRFIGDVRMEVSPKTAPVVMIAHSVSEPLIVPGESRETPPSSSEMKTGPPRPAQNVFQFPTRKRFALLVVAISAISIAVGYGAHQWLTRSKSPDPREFRISALTHTGAVTNVAISPDGRYVAYAQRKAGKESLWLNDLDKHNETQVVPGGTGFHGLSFSPDSSRVYFVRSDEKDPFFKYLYAVSTFGGPAQKLITDVDSPVSFSPDGRKFVYEHSIQPRNDIELKIANVDGSDERLLTTIHDGSGFLFQPGPNWSPDGRTVAVPVLIANQRLRWVLDLVFVADGSVKELYTGREDLGRPVWVSGGSALVFPRRDETTQRFQLWTVSVPAGRAQALTHDLSDYGTDLDMTRDGRTFTATAATTTSHIWIAPAGNLSQSEGVTSDALSTIEVSEATDGKLLSRSADGMVWMMHTDGSQRVRFAEFQKVTFPSACGRYVILLTKDRDTEELVRVDRDGTHPATLARGNLWSPACSADGNFVLYVTFDQPQKIWKVPILGGPVLYVGDVPGDQVSGRLAVSPDGKLLAFPYTQYGRVPSEGWQIGAMPVDGGHLVKQFKMGGGFLGVVWSPSGTGLQYVVTRNGVDNIWEQPLAGGKPKQLTHFTTAQIFDFHWSLDHTRLLLTRGDVNKDAVLLSNFQ